MKVFGKNMKSRVGLVIAGTTLGLVPASTALAGGGGGGPPSMGAISFPIDLESVATAIAVAGGTILLLVFGISVGFSLAKKLMKRTKETV